MKVTIEEQLSKNYGMDEWGLQRFSVRAEKGDEIKRFSLGEGEPEDMIFGRNIHGPGSIDKMLEMAHAAGTNGEELKIEHKEEKW